jgi:hypothetical protein
VRVSTKELTQLERAEAQLDALIERRAREAQAANAAAYAEAGQVRRSNPRRAAEIRREWCDYHRRMIAVAQDLADRHRAALGRLIDSAAGEAGT